MNLTWLLRMAKWARHPPSPRMVKIAAIAVAAALAVVALDWLGLWPDWARVEKLPRAPRP
ncbi:hypothetical protein [Phaeovulum sp. NW3]|uniref:hypothetical protein n=1 Tax=Phaeovulum sp. NW3 TaxID=2934933 RepID=UPI002020F714|nr:hypothetical protein [Phaeovulum sp. NW3]MCL7463968.1 hypothetical protein [Phaeovulum sp. NW3]